MDMGGARTIIGGMKTAVQRLLLADGNPLVREGLRSLLETYPQMQVVAEAATAQEALDALQSDDPNVAIIGISLSDIDEIELVRAIKRERPATRVLIYTMRSSDEAAARALRAGASDYVVKGDSGHELLSALIGRA
jgi:DNA-binding NarL/FixJ family response regulator